ncbi:MAG: ACT domain-containing protein [Calothrix sp. SM1_5_4]|nr:ACT domain-containing protein [Calothrix sp. SM1_5_4]
MTLRQVPGEFSIGRYSADIRIEALYSRNFCSITRTTQEVSVVCESDLLPPGAISREDGWACLEVDGTWDFSVSAVLSRIGAALSSKEVSVFAASTFDTDYILVKRKILDKIRSALKGSGVDIILTSG